MRKVNGWLARDRSGVLFFYNEKPNKGHGVWLGKNESGYPVEDSTEKFSAVPWEDEPVEMALVPVERLAALEALPELLKILSN